MPRKLLRLLDNTPAHFAIAQNGQPQEYVARRIVSMNILCPKCAEVMMIVDRQGVHIDYCNKCQGVFLDRGELEKLIQLSLQPNPVYQQVPYQQPVYQPPQQPMHRQDDDYDYNYKGRRRRRSFLGDIFDFD